MGRCRNRENQHAFCECNTERRKSVYQPQQRVIFWTFVVPFLSGLHVFPNIIACIDSELSRVVKSIAETHFSIFPPFCSPKCQDITPWNTYTGTLLITVYKEEQRLMFGCQSIRAHCFHSIATASFPIRNSDRIISEEPVLLLSQVIEDRYSRTCIVSW